MRIAIDAMGGDHAPDKIIQGAIESLPSLESGDELIIVGPEELLREKLAAVLRTHHNVRIEPASQVIGMDESPVEAVRKKRHSSIVRMVKLAAGGGADAIISAGNTGALVAAGVLMLKGLPGVERPGIAIPIPNGHNRVLFCDAGANVQPKPVHLHQYAILAAVYAQTLYNIEKPRVGLLNIGTEDEKGTQLVKETRSLLEKDAGMNFVGYVEGRDIFSDQCDVVITDGFTGNVVLKVIEGMGGALLKTLKGQLAELPTSTADQLTPIIKKTFRLYDHEEYGGALLLGVSGLFLKVHGSGGAKAIRNAVQAVKLTTRHNINERIAECLATRVA
ncbi:MAG: phosphate acyltransferase PlsX [Planctomycetia bacterium]|nr:phosphate acyltransferase PlsX [Planctomycetia bacterium]